MRKLVALLVIVALLVTALPMPADAGGSSDAALALAAFAVFTQLFVAPFYYFARPAYAAPPQAVYSPPVYSEPSAYAAEPSTYAAAAPQPAMVSREVVHPTGRYVLYGDGVTTAYQWVWMPGRSIPPPPPGRPPAPPAR